MVHFFSESLHISFRGRRMKVLSFTSGMFVCYLFLHLLPMLYAETRIEISMLSVLFGFSLFHVIEKCIYKHAKKTSELKREMKEVHSMSFFIYHLLIGMVLVRLISEGLTNTLLFFFPLLLITAMGSVSLKYLYASKDIQAKFLLSISTLIGALFATLFAIPAAVFTSILGFMIGTLMYTILMDAIPKEREGEPAFFVLGLVLYAAIIMLIWFA